MADLGGCEIAVGFKQNTHIAGDILRVVADYLFIKILTSPLGFICGIAISRLIIGGKMRKRGMFSLLRDSPFVIDLRLIEALIR